LSIPVESPRAAAVWSSKFAFLVSAVGAAVGLGSLWRFPYVAGVSGGSAFLLVYVAFVAMLCIPIMMAEMVIGRRRKSSAIESVNALVREEGAGGGWKAIGWLSVLIPFVGLSYYAVVAGWVMDYTWQSLVGGFAGLDGARSAAHFTERTADPVAQLAVHAAFVASAAACVAFGVNRGIERISKIMMPALFLLLIGLVVYNAIALDFARGAAFLLAPDFSRLTSETVLLALGQAFYSTAIGVGVMMTYSAYLPKDVSLPASAAVICGSVVLTAVLAGLAIFPMVFHYGLTPDGGPNLSFVTLPVAFAQMPAGQLVGAAFFVLMFFAAFTTAIGMLEPTVAWVVERMRSGRARATLVVAGLTWVIGVPSVLSFNVLADVHPLSGVRGFETRTIFDIIDFTIANLLLPVNALLIALFVGWRLRSDATADELGIGRGFAFRSWRFLLAVVAPAAILVILADLWI
jgi:neurotransmitter:Na+ symporter, NSS family